MADTYINNLPPADTPQAADAIIVEQSEGTKRLNLNDLFVKGGAGTETLTSLSLDLVNNKIDYSDEAGNVSSILASDIKSLYESNDNVDTITSNEILDGAVTTLKIDDGAVTPPKLSNGAPSWETDGETTFSYDGSTTSGIYTTPGGTKTIYVGNFDSNAQLWVKSDTSGYGQLVFGDSNNNSVGSLLYDHSNNSLKFITNDAERMRINSNGIVTVGRTDINPYDNASFPGIALHGDGSQAGLISSARVDSSAAAFNRISSNGTIIGLRKDGVGVGSISVTSSGTSYNTSSDYRLKEDIIEIDNSLDRLKLLKPCNFAWKVDGSRVDGFIAHEAQEVVPEAVTGTKDAVDEDGNPDYQGIDQSKLVPLLTKALQEAIAKIENLEARITTLEA